MLPLYKRVVMLAVPVLQNLITLRTLTSSAVSDDDSVAVHGSDTGVGIHADMRDKLFCHSRPARLRDYQEYVARRIAVISSERNVK